jgi:CelD/BcsL family acetyltransferase involved in cellulose biosynthesis
MADLSVDMTPMTDLAALADRWRAHEGRVGGSFFLSWTWIGAWVARLERPPLLLAVTDAAGNDVALGLFTQSVERRQKVLRVRQLRLHDTGIRASDAITIEYNSLLCAPDDEGTIWAAAIASLRAHGGWDELVVSGATEGTADILAKLGLGLHRRAETSSAYVDLSALRAQGIGDRAGYVGTLGKNTRSQIRRSIRLYEERGPLTLTACDDVESFFAELGTHHEAKWREAGIDGATANTAYMAFHRTMIADALPRGEVELLRACAGDEAFGWLYNFVWRGHVLFYLSGFRAEDDNRLKPGLVTHALAVERHLRAGRDVYDFMGGTNRYKTSLGQPGPDIVSLAVQRRVPKLALEGLARGLKERLRA